MPWGGSIASVFCTGLTGISGVVEAESHPLPLELAGVRVIQHSADYALVSPDNPARAREVIIGYLTGLLVWPRPPVATGQPTPDNQPGWEKLVLVPSTGVPTLVYQIWVGVP